MFRIEKVEEEEGGRSFWKNNTSNPELVVKCAPVAVNGQKNQQLHSVLLRTKSGRLCKGPHVAAPLIFLLNTFGPLLLGRWEICFADGVLQ